MTGLLLLALLIPADHRPIVGLPAPELRLSAINDGADLAPGRLTVVALFSTWCPNCERSLPRLADTLAGEPDVDLIAVSNEHADAVAEYLAGNPLPMPVAVDADRWTTLAYRVNAVPRVLVIAPDGRLLADTYPARLTPDTLAALRRGEVPDLPLHGVRR